MEKEVFCNLDRPGHIDPDQLHCTNGNHMVYNRKDKVSGRSFLYALAGFLPQAVLGMFIGVLIDQHDRKKIMICSDLVMSSACVALAVSGIWDIPIWLIFIVLFIRSIGNAFYAPVPSGYYAVHLTKDQLTKYAGYSQSFESASMIASPAIAAVLYSMFPLKAILMLDVLGAFFAVGTLAAVDIPGIFREDKEKTNLLAEVKEGYNVMRRVPGMQELLVIGALYAVIYFPIGTLYPLITMSYFNGSVRNRGWWRLFLQRVPWLALFPWVYGADG